MRIATGIPPRQRSTGGVMCRQVAWGVLCGAAWWALAGGAVADDVAQAEDGVAAPSDANAQATNPAANPAARDPLEEQIAIQAVQFEGGFTNLLYGELESIRSLCGDIPVESRRSISRAGELAVKAASLRLSRLQHAGLQQPGGPVAVVVANGFAGAWRALFGLANGKPAEPVVVEKDAPAAADDPFQIMTAALTASVAEHVGAEQGQAFADLVAKREERFRAAAVRRIVERLDADLFLTARQREAIGKSLSENWNSRIAIESVRYQMNQGQPLASKLPAACVKPHLTEAQATRYDEPVGGNTSFDPPVWYEFVKRISDLEGMQPDPWWSE